MDSDKVFDIGEDQPYADSNLDNAGIVELFVPGEDLPLKLTPKLARDLAERLFRHARYAQELKDLKELHYARNANGEL